MGSFFQLRIGWGPLPTVNADPERGKGRRAVTSVNRRAGETPDRRPLWGAWERREENRCCSLTRLGFPCAHPFHFYFPTLFFFKIGLFPVNFLLKNSHLSWETRRFTVLGKRVKCGECPAPPDGSPPHAPPAPGCWRRTGTRSQRSESSRCEWG